MYIFWLEPADKKSINLKPRQAIYANHCCNEYLKIKYTEDQ